MPTTFNPSYSGRIGRSDLVAVTYPVVHDNADGNNNGFDNETPSGGPGNQLFSGEYIIDRSVIHFDTSSLGAGATITAATLRIYVNSKSDADNDGISVVNSQIASNTAIVNADFDQVGDAVTTPTKFASDIDLGSITTGAYNEFALNAAGLAAISKTGITKLGLRTVNDCAETTPTGRSFINIDGNGGTNEPELVVTFTPGAGAGRANSNLLLMGV